MVLIIVGLGMIAGIVLICVGWITHYIQIDYNPPSRQEIDLLKYEAATAKTEDQPLKWMQVADAEAEFRESTEPKVRWGIMIMDLGILVIIFSSIFLIICSFIW